MLLHLLRLLPLLIPSDAGEAGGAEGQSGDADTERDAGGTPDAATATEDRASSRPEPSANKLIKDFVKAQGITVEDLIREYGELKDANKSEFQRLEGERDQYRTKAEQLEQQYRSAVARSAVTDEATKAGAISAKAVYHLIRDDVEFDDSGEPTNIADLIAQAKADEPQLFRAAGGSGDGGKGNGQGQARDINEVFRQMARNAT